MKILEKNSIKPILGPKQLITLLKNKAKLFLKKYLADQK